MPPIISPDRLAEELTVESAVDLAYPEQLVDLASALERGIRCLIECSRDLTPALFVNLRNRLKGSGLRTIYVDGRPRPDEKPDPLGRGAITQMLQVLREVVRGSADRQVIVLPHFDLMTSSPSGLSVEAREILMLLHENPAIVFLAFRDPLVAVPPAVENLPFHRMTFQGVDRTRLQYVITRREGRKFGLEVDLGALHQQVAGLHAVRLRYLLSTFAREDFPNASRSALIEFRRLTLPGNLTVPDATFETLCGCGTIKQRLREEVLEVMARIAEAETFELRSRQEKLLPRGIFFTGPVRLAKRRVVCALANALGAVLIETTGAELKSPYLGGSEENLRQVFSKARQAAPAIILLNDLDLLATPPDRSSHAVERSMLSQLQQEMDRLLPSDLVLVAGTAQTREHLDCSLFETGRFELVLDVGEPTAEDRRKYLQRLNQTLELSLTADAMERVIAATGGHVGHPIHGEGGVEFVCRALARLRLREGRTGPTQPADVEQVVRNSA